MSTSPRLEKVRRRLIRAGATPAYVARLIGELADHREDAMDELIRGGATIQEAARHADQRLGKTDELVEAALASLRRRSFAGRHPVVMMLLAPPMVLIVGYAATLLLAALLAGLLSPSFRVGATSPLGRWVLSAACWVCTYVLPAVMAAMFMAVAARGQRRRWGWVAAGLIAALAAMTFVSVFLDTGGARGRLVMGVSGTPNVVRMLPPLAMVVLLELRNRRRMRRALA
jgi:hypothetical protein